MQELYLELQEPIELNKPSARDFLLDTYNLDLLAASVSRTDPVTGAKRKLRKSYRNHIADLAGRHTIPGIGETRWSLQDLAARPIDITAPVGQLSDALIEAVKFERSPLTGIPGFDVQLLATCNTGADTISRSKPSSPKLVRRKRREIGIATPTSGSATEKRRKLV